MTQILVDVDEHNADMALELIRATLARFRMKNTTRKVIQP